MLDDIVLRTLERLVGEGCIEYSPLAGMFSLVGAVPSIVETRFLRARIIKDPFVYVSLCLVDVAVRFGRVEQ